MWLGLRGELGAPSAVALLVVIARYLEAFTTLGELSGAIGAASATVERVQAVLEAPRLPEGARDWRPEGAPRIELQGIRFGHTKDDRRVLENLDLTLEAGTTTAIVGPSGAGKSTLLGLLAGLHVPEAGSLRVDGVDVTELTADARRELTSAVFQHPFLFEGRCWRTSGSALRGRKRTPSTRPCASPAWRRLWSGSRMARHIGWERRGVRSPAVSVSG